MRVGGNPCINALVFVHDNACTVRVRMLKLKHVAATITDETHPEAIRHFLIRLQV